MIKKLGIPMVAIRVFATVGRCGNFTRAAQALGITQSAVSRHVATLETLAQLTLFERRGPNITMTPSGSQFYEAVRDAVSTIELATQQMVQRRTSHDRLTIRTSMPSFAMTVVVPMLGAFMESHKIQVDLITSLSPPEPHEEFDVLISRDQVLHGTESWELVKEDLVCVGSAAMVAAHHGQTVSNWPLIAAKSRPDTIALWAVAKDIPVDRLHVGAVYDHLFLAVAAAIGSAGLLVVPRIIVRDQLRNGTLVSADDEPVASGATYLAYVNTQSRHVDASREFCRWLKRTLRDSTEDF